MGFIAFFWIIGFFISLVFFIKKIWVYKNGKSTEKPLIYGIITFLLALPIVIFLILLIGLSTGLTGM